MLPLKLFVNNKRKFLIITLLVMFACIVKLVHLDAMQVAYPLRVDALQYTNMAINIAEKGVFADAIHPNSLEINRLPGYPLILSAIWLGSDDIVRFYKNALFLNVVFGVFSVVLLYLIACERFSVRISITLAVLLMLNPHVLSLEGYVLTESIFLFEILLLIWLISRALTSNNENWWIAVGVVIGYALLTRPSFLFFLPFMGLLYFLADKDKNVVKALFIRGVLGISITILPWILYTQSHGISFSGTKSDSATLSAGFYPNFVYKDPKYYGVPYKDPAAPNIHHDTGKALKQLKDWVIEEPIKYISWFFIGKPLALWQWDTIQGAGDVYIYEVIRSAFKNNTLFIVLISIYRAVYPLMLLLMLVGVIVVIIQRNDLLMFSICSVLLYFVCIHIVFFSLPRYSIPLRPLMLYMDAFTLHYLYKKWLQRRHISLS